MIVGKLMVILGLDKTGFDTGINSATGKTTAFKKVTDSTFKAIQKGIKVAMIASAVAVVNAVKDFGKFEAALANVSTMLSKETMPMMKDFEKGVLSMSQKFGEGTDTLSKGLYDILSASIPASQAMEVLEVSTMAAKAGVTDTGVAADALTTLMNSFADSTKDAAYYSDILFAATKLGKTTFGELAGSVGNVATLFSTAGGSAEEMAGMLAILTRNGINTATATTNLKGIITALLKPSEALTEHLGGMTMQADGFEAIMAKVAGLPPTDLAEMFPNVRALTGVVVAAEGLSEEVEKINGLMADGSPAQEAFEKQTGTLTYQWNQFKETLKATSIIIGKEVAPQFQVMFAELTEWFSKNQGKIAEFFKGFVDTIKNVVVFVGNFKDVILELGVALATLSVVDKASKGIAALTSATALGLGPISAVAAGVGLLVMALTKIHKISKQYAADQEILNRTIEGSADSVEEYNKGLEISTANIEKLKTKQLEAGRSTSRLYEGMKVQTKEEKEAAEEKIRLAEEEYQTIIDNKEDFIYWEERRIEVEAEKAEAETKAYLLNQQRIAQEVSDDATQTAIAENRLAEAQDILDELAYSKLTMKERYDAEIKRLLELGLTQKQVMEYMALNAEEYSDGTTEELAKITKAAEDEYNKMVGKYYAPQSEAAKNMWAQFGDAANEAFGIVEETAEESIEESITFLDKLKTFIEDDLTTAILDGFKSISTGFSSFIGQLADNQVAVVEDTYADLIDAEYEYQDFLSEQYEIKTAAENEYADFLAQKDEERKAARLEDLADLEAELQAETDATKRAELAKQIATLKTAIEEEKLKEAAVAAEAKRKADEKAAEDLWNAQQEQNAQDVADAVVKAEEDKAAEILAIKRKQAKLDKAIALTNAIIDTASAIIKALVTPGPAGIAMSIAAGITGALSIATISAQPLPMIKGGVAGMTESGVFSGKPGIDTNNVALTTGEYVMPPEQTRNNIDELEAMRSGSYGGGGGGISPVPVSLYLDSEKIGEAMIEFITAESDGGRFRMNPKVLGVP